MAVPASGNDNRCALCELTSTPVVIPTAPPADAGVARFTPEDPVDVVAVD
jgi:hypothetical protein